MRWLSTNRGDPRRREAGRCGRRGLLLQWHVTERCNLRCAHCYQESATGEELEFRDLLRVLDQFKTLLEVWKGTAGPRSHRGHITLTGGEPFVRSDFQDLLEVLASQKRRFRFAILTNGSFVDATLARRLRKWEPAYVQVSLEGAPETHDGIRGPGSHDRTVAAIRHLVREGVSTMLSFTAHRGNFREFPEVARLGRRLGVTRVWADRLIPMGSGEALRQEMLTPEETREFFQLMYQARADAARSRFRRTEIAMHRALQFLVAGGTPYRCTAGETLLTVMQNGDLYPCRRMPVRVGNLMEAPLTELYGKSEFLQALRSRNHTPRGCKDCCYAPWCRGGLRCLAYAVARNPFEADPGCWLAERQGSDGSTG